MSLICKYFLAASCQKRYATSEDSVSKLQLHHNKASKFVVQSQTDVPENQTTSTLSIQPNEVLAATHSGFMKLFLICFLLVVVLSY